MRPVIFFVALAFAGQAAIANASPELSQSCRYLPGSEQPLAQSDATKGAVVQFADALSRVWAVHPDVCRAQQALQETGYDITAAYSGFLPYAQLDLGRNRVSDTYIARFVLPLFSGGSTLAAVEGAKASQNQALAELAQTRLQLALRLTDAWFNWIASREQDALFIAYITELEGLHGVIERRANEGAAPQSDVINALSRVRQAEAQAEANRAVMGATEAQLLALLGTSVLAKATWPDQEQSLTAEEAAAAWARASETHPAIQSALANLDRLDAERRSNLGRIFPELSLRHTKPFGDEAKLTSESTELVLQYQTDNGFRALQGVRASASRLEGARASVENAKRDVLAAINQAAAERRAATLQLGYQQEAVTAARDLIDSFVRQFEVGRKTWVEVLNAQREAQDTRLQLVQQKRAFWVADRRVALQGVYWDNLLRELDATPGAGN